MRIQRTFVYETALFKNFVPVPMKFNDKFIKNESCVKDIKITAWHIS